MGDALLHSTVDAQAIDPLSLWEQNSLGHQANSIWRPRENLSIQTETQPGVSENCRELRTHLRRSLFLDPDLERRGELSERRCDH